MVCWLVVWCVGGLFCGCVVLSAWWLVVFCAAGGLVVLRFVCVCSAGLLLGLLCLSAFFVVCACVRFCLFVYSSCIRYRCVVASDQVGFTKYTSPPTPPHHLTSPNSDRAHSCSLAVVSLRRPRPAKRQLTPFVLDATCEDMALRQLTSFVLAGGHLSLGHACEAPRELGHACDAPRELGHACDAPVSG